MEFGCILRFRFKIRIGMEIWIGIVTRIWVRTWVGIRIEIGSETGIYRWI